jgi:hypothetical protein
MAKFNVKYIADGVTLSGKADATNASAVKDALSRAVISEQAARKPRKPKGEAAAAAPAAAAGKGK